MVEKNGMKWFGGLEKLKKIKKNRMEWNEGNEYTNK